MARIPSFFNATQYFGTGSTNPNKDSQDSFWDQQSASVNQSLGGFNRNIVEPNHLLNNTQEYFADGWEDWPDDFDESEIQDNELNGFDPGSEKLVVPNHEDTSSSSEDSPPPGMEPELNSWMEEETTPYSYAPYNHSGASVINGQFNPEQPGVLAQYDGRSYASVCEAGSTANNPSWQQPTNSNYHPDPFGVQEVIPDVANSHENVPDLESWSREPELGSWSPNFGYDESFGNSTQEAPSPAPPQVSGFIQGPQVNLFRPSEDLDAHVPPREAAVSSAADVFGHNEGRHNSSWSSPFATDLQKAALWGNLPDIHHPSGQMPVEENAGSMGQQNSSGLFHETVTSRSDQQPSFQQYPGAPIEDSYFHQNAGAVAQQNSSGLFHETVTSKPDQHTSLLQQYPGVPTEDSHFQQNTGSVGQQNASGLFLETVTSKPDQHVSLQQSPGVPAEDSHFQQNTGAVGQQNSSGFFHETATSKPDQNASLQEYPGVPAEDSHFHQNAGAVGQQDSPGPFHETVTSKPDQHASLQQYPGLPVEDNYFHQNAVTVGHQNASGLFQESLTLKPEDQQPSLQQYPGVVVEDSHFHQNAVAAGQQNSSGLFQNSLASKPEGQQISLPHYPGVESPSGAFQETMVAEQDQQFSLQQYPGLESPSGFFKLNSGSEPVISEDISKGQLASQPNSITDSMQNDPRDRPQSEESPSVEPLDQDSDCVINQLLNAQQPDIIAQVPEKHSQQDVLRASAISEQETPDLAQNSFVPGYNSANLEPTQLQELNVTPNATSEWLALGQDKSLPDSSQPVQDSAAPAEFSEQSVNHDIRNPSDVVQESFSHENSIAEILHLQETSKHSLTPDTPGAPDVTRDSFYHDRSSINSLQPLQLKRESSEQSRTPDISVEPDSPGDAVQAAFHQKQLAGKAPAASPRTSLWMNGSALSTPCVLAPAAVVMPVDTHQLHKNDQASHKKQEPPPSVRVMPRSIQPHSVGTMHPTAVSLQSPPIHPQGTALPATATACEKVQSGESNVFVQPAEQVNQQMTPAPSALVPTPPSAYPDGHTTGHPLAVPHSAGVTSVPTFSDGQGPGAELPLKVNPQVPSVSSASVLTPLPTHPDNKGTIVPPVASLMSPPVHSSVRACSISAQPGNAVTELPPPASQQIPSFPSSLTPTEESTCPSTENSMLPAMASHPVQSNSPASAGLTPASTHPVNEHTVLPTAFTQITSSIPPMLDDDMHKKHDSRVMPAIDPSLVATKCEQKNESANPMSLVSLLQGGQPRPKKKTLEAPVSDAGLSHTAMDPVNSFSNSQQSGSLNSNPVLSADQCNSELETVPPQNSSREIGHQSFDSFRRPDESWNSYEREHNNPYPQEQRSSAGELYNHDPAGFYDRQDPYYQHDQRDSYESHYRKDPYKYEHDSRDLERKHYDRRESERRNFDRRVEYDRRSDSDYSRRSYDNSREYDRWGYDRRDGRRDSYENRDSYYGYGYSPRMGRHGYNESRGSREDIYRGSHQYTGRSTPSSQDRNSPVPYDYSASPYASHQYGYPSYTDSQSMDLYQYQYMMYLYQFHPQHYEQYCHQLGYYSSGYTPEQLAQYYAGYGYENSQPTEQAPEQVVLQPEPSRSTPLLYRVQHPLLRFSGDKLVSLIGGDDTETPRCTIASVQMNFSMKDTEVIKLFPGPLSSQYSSRTEVMTFCERQSYDALSSADEFGLIKSLVWKILATLVKHNGAFVASDLAEVIMENWKTCTPSWKNEFLAPVSPPPVEGDINQHVMVFREMLLTGATKDALEYCMKFQLWGHAMMLASKLNKKIQVQVSNRFLKTMTDFDPIKTVYDHLSGRQPVASMTPSDWQRSLAAMVANPPHQHPQCIKKNITCLGDTLMSNEQVWAAHLCYVLAGEKFGFPSEDKTKMAIIGINHRTNTISGQRIPLENLQMMEVLEYAFSLSNEEFFIPVLQPYKVIHAKNLAEAGFTEEALQYGELVGEMIIKHPTNASVTLVKNVRELTAHLKGNNDQEAAELLEMLDKVIQTKETTSQISSSDSESEIEVEEPLAESSASFFSGYDQSSNTPKHQSEQTEDAQRQLSYTEASLSAPSACSVNQEPPASDYQQDSWPTVMPTDNNQETFTGEVDTQASQPELPPVMIPKAPEPAPQVPFFVPGAPVAQPLPVQYEQTETVEEQPVYVRQWPEESKMVEPLLPKEPDVPKKAESKPKPDEKTKKKKEAARNSPMSGWFSGLLSKVMPRGPNEMILPDDNKKSIYWDEKLKKWVNTDEDEQESAPPPPPPSDMQLGGGGPSIKPFGNITPATSGITTHSVGTPSFPGPAALQQTAAPGGIPAGMATPPAVSKFSRKAYGGGRLAKKYVDVLNPTGQSSSGPAMLPNSLLPTFPGPTSAINPASLFVPSPVTAPSDEEQTANEPVVANPGSRPSSPTNEEDGADQQSQHSRSSSVSLTSAEVRSFMMSQIPDPPPQNAAPMFFDPAAFSQPKAQTFPRKSRYPGQIRK